MPETVYLLCAATSVTCAMLLFRGYRQQHSRLLLWSHLCFVLLALNNILLFIDLIVVPTSVDLSLWRGATALAGVECAALRPYLGVEMSDSMNAFFWGATAMACWAVGLIFLRSWRFTADRFFALFGAAFWILSMHWVALWRSLAPQMKPATIFMPSVCLVFSSYLSRLPTRTTDRRPDGSRQGRCNYALHPRCRASCKHRIFARNAGYPDPWALRSTTPAAERICLDGCSAKNTTLTRWARQRDSSTVNVSLGR